MFRSGVDHHRPSHECRSVPVWQNHQVTATLHTVPVANRCIVFGQVAAADNIATSDYASATLKDTVDLADLILA